MFNTIKKYLILALAGGTIYYFIEYIWKNFISIGGICHWSMFLLGSLCFILIGLINEFLPWDTSIIIQGIIGSSIITITELIFGVILNIYLKLNIWNYSTMPFNFLGQICLPFSIMWIALSLVAIILDDYLRWTWFGEEKPHYKL